MGDSSGRTSKGRRTGIASCGFSESWDCSHADKPLQLGKCTKVPRNIGVQGGGLKKGIIGKTNRIVNRVSIKEESLCINI